MSDYILLGGGGYAFSLLDILNESDATILGFHAESKSTQTELAFIEDLEWTISQNPAIQLINAVGISSGTTKRAEIFESLKAKNQCFPPLISTRSYVSAGAEFGSGVHIFHGAIIERGVTLGANTVVGTNSSVHHESRIGKHSFIGPGARILGNCHIGQNSNIGSNAVIAPGITVGNNCKIAAGSFLRSNLPDGGKNY